MSFGDHILLPTDGSEGALHAAAFAGELARALKAKVSVLHILSDEYLMSHTWDTDGLIVGSPSGYLMSDPEGMKSVEEIRSSIEQQALAEELAKTAQALGDIDQEPNLVTVWGHAAEEISRFAKDNKVELIIIGSYGKSKLKRAFLGSVSQAVANQAPCPVTIVK